MIGGRERESRVVSDGIHSHMKRRASGVRAESFILTAVAVAARKKAGSLGSGIIQREEERGWADGESHQTATEKKREGV